MNEFVYTGDREDSAGATRVVLPAVTLWNLVVTYKLAGAEYFVRVNNLNNTFYEDIQNYLTPGRFVWLGARLVY